MKTPFRDSSRIFIPLTLSPHDFTPSLFLPYLFFRIWARFLYPFQDTMLGSVSFERSTCSLSPPTHSVAYSILGQIFRNEVIPWSPLPFSEGLLHESGHYRQMSSDVPIFNQKYIRDISSNASFPGISPPFEAKILSQISTFSIPSICHTRACNRCRSAPLASYLTFYLSAEG